LFPPSRGALQPTRTLDSLPPADWATQRARVVLDRARAEAANRHSRQVDPEHLLIALLQEEGGMARALMDQLASDRTTLARNAAAAIEETLATDEPFELEIPYSESAEAVLRHAFHAARSGSDRRVGTDHILLGLLLEATAPAARVLNEAGLTVDAVTAQRNRMIG
jgi:ATP-dependent Clp protease ATP-binding subunit ClpA